MSIERVMPSNYLILCLSADTICGKWLSHQNLFEHLYHCSFGYSIFHFFVTNITQLKSHTFYEVFPDPPTQSDFSFF